MEILIQSGCNERTLYHVDGEELVGPGAPAHCHRQEEEYHTKHPHTLFAAACLRARAKLLLRVAILTDVDHPPEVDGETDELPECPASLPHHRAVQVKLWVLAIGFLYLETHETAGDE